MEKDKIKEEGTRGGGTWREKKGGALERKSEKRRKEIGYRSEHQTGSDGHQI